jgi:hypothetical protein
LALGNFWDFLQFRHFYTNSERSCKLAIVLILNCFSFNFLTLAGTSGCGFETPCVQKHFFPSNNVTMLEYFTLSCENKEIVSEIPHLRK